MMRPVQLEAAWQRQDAKVERMKNAPTRAEASGSEQLHNALRVEVSSLERLLQSVAIRVKRAADKRAGEVAWETSREPIRIIIATPPVAGEDGKICVWWTYLSSRWLDTQNRGCNVGLRGWTTTSSVLSAIVATQAGRLMDTPTAGLGPRGPPSDSGAAGATVTPRSPLPGGNASIREVLGRLGRHSVRPGAGAEARCLVRQGSKSAYPSEAATALTRTTCCLIALDALALTRWTRCIIREPIGSIPAGADARSMDVWADLLQCAGRTGIDAWRPPVGIPRVT